MIQEVWRFTTAFTAARVVRQIVASTNIPVASIINGEDAVTSAKNKAKMLPHHTRPVKRIIFAGGLNLLRKLRSRAQGAK